MEKQYEQDMKAEFTSHGIVFNFDIKDKENNKETCLCGKPATKGTITEAGTAYFCDCITCYCFKIFQPQIS